MSPESNYSTTNFKQKKPYQKATQFSLFHTDGKSVYARKRHKYNVRESLCLLIFIEGRRGLHLHEQWFKRQKESDSNKAREMHKTFF